MMNGIQQSQPSDLVMSNYQTIVQLPMAGQMSNSLQQYIQMGEMNHGGNNMQIGNSDLMFNPSGGVQPFSGGVPMASNGMSNDHFTQILPQLHPMKAAPMGVSALSHGAPHTSHQQELGITQKLTNSASNCNRAFSSFSPQTSSMIQRQHQQRAHEMNQNYKQSPARLSHPGENMNLQQPNLRLPQQLATVPKQKLSNLKSIVSIRQEQTEAKERPKLQHKENHLNMKHVQKSLRLNRHPSDFTSAVSTITKKQMEDRQQSSYSSACNATIKAQQQLSVEQQHQILYTKNNHIGIEQDENDTKDQANRSLAGGANAIANLPSVVNSLSYDTISPGTGTKRNLDGGARSMNNDKETAELTRDVTMKKLEPQHKYVQVVGGKVDSLNLPNPLISPHDYLKKLLISRGYSTKHYCSLEGGYYCRPTPLQCASYGISVVNAVRTSNLNLFKNLLSAGISRNPCNKFGESILHMVCRRGDHDLLKLLLDQGSTIQVSDDFGRTPLHDACWTVKPNFKSIEMLLERDVRLLHIVDCRGSPPLEYVKKESWGEWIQFFDRKKEVFWPQRNLIEESEEGPPQLVNVPPHARPVPDPENCATLDDAVMFSSGKKVPA